MRIQLVVIILALGCMPATVWAKDQRRVTRTGPTSRSWVTFEKRKHQSPWKKQAGWANQARGKFIFGSKNTLLGWTELITEPYQAAHKGRNVAMGVGKGVINGLADTVGGAVHLVTFPVTALDLPLPEGGVRL